MECQYFTGLGIKEAWVLVVCSKVFFVKTHAVPVLKDAAKFVGTEAIKTATNITADAIDGKNFNESVKERAKETIEKIGDKVTSVIQKGGKAKNYKKRKLGSQKKHNIKKIKKYQDIFENEFVT